MPEGPLGFPRLTSIFPFVNEEAEQELYIREEPFSGRPNNVLARTLIDREFISEPVGLEVFMSLILREPLEDKPKGVLERIKWEMNLLTRENNVASGDYALYTREKAAVLGFIRVDEEFQMSGIGEKMLDNILLHAKQKGAEVAYANPISKGGTALLENAGFTRRTDLFGEDENIWSLEL